MIRLLKTKINNLFLKKIEGVTINTKNLKLKSIGTLRSEGKARLGLGMPETSDFFESKDPSYLDNRGTIQLGDQSRITQTFRIINKGVITIGAHSYVNPNAVIRIQKALTIGDHCAISWNCTFMDTHAHKVNGEDIPKEISIGHHVWIGAHVMVLKGAAIGNHCIVAAGSVVTGTFGDNVLIGGVPAKVIKENISWEI
jgi:acetyltransferase-like isoleucine patch superfamily enzyme